MFSRFGKKFTLPQEIIDSMPHDIFLDGELWYVQNINTSHAALSFLQCSSSSFFFRFGRDNFQESAKIARRMDHSRIDWNSFRFMVFDSPSSKGTYSERYSLLRTFPNKPKKKY